MNAIENAKEVLEIQRKTIGFLVKGLSKYVRPDAEAIIMLGEIEKAYNNAVVKLDALEAKNPGLMRCPSCHCVVDRKGRGDHSVADCIFVNIQAEKPAEDAKSLAIDIIDQLACDEYIGPQIGEEELTVIIQSFAESYHAKKCAECKPSGWISVKERMPHEMEPVLIYDGTMQIDQLVDAGDFPELQWEYNIENPGVTHWQPLPEAPK